VLTLDSYLLKLNAIKPLIQTATGESQRPLRKF
jgi:hypothetical protein